jgi:hypothetical protein
MARRVYIFADEGGDLVFKPPGNGVSRYFTIGTVTMADCSVGAELLRLRRELAWSGSILPAFHATTDKQRVRDRVFKVLAQADFRLDATILDKRKAQDHLRADPLYFFQEAWYLHAKWIAPRVVRPADELLVVASSLQINRKKKAAAYAVRDVVSQVSPTARSHVAFWPASNDPCLQAADYATWAIQRKYESGDTRSYDLISSKIKSEFQPFLVGTKVYY